MVTLMDRVAKQGPPRGQIGWMSSRREHGRLLSPIFLSPGLWKGSSGELARRGRHVCSWPGFCSTWSVHSKGVKGRLPEHEGWEVEVQVRQEVASLGIS